MSDIYVQPLASGWTVRHDRILFERFADRAMASRRARQLAMTLRRRGESPILHVLERTGSERRRT